MQSLEHDQRVFTVVGVGGYKPPFRVVRVLNLGEHAESMRALCDLGHHARIVLTVFLTAGRYNEQDFFVRIDQVYLRFLVQVDPAKEVTEFFCGYVNGHDARKVAHASFDMGDGH